MIKRSIAALMLMLTVLNGCTAAVANSPRGRMAKVHSNDGLEWRGELLAATRDSIWVLNGSRIDRFDVPSLRRVEIPRHAFGKATTLWASAAVGAVVGVAMVVACGRFNEMQDDEHASCGGVIPAFVALYVLVGAVLSIPNHFSSTHRIRPDSTDKLRLFARFPQGMPDTISVERLLPKP
jgi:hypothetical protein